MHLCLGFKVNTKPLCVEQPTVSMVKEAESPWRIRQEWEGGADLGNRTGV